MSKHTNEELLRLLERVSRVVGDQQYTLASLGWNIEDTCHCNQTHYVAVGRQWSKAGARRYQYEAVQDVMYDVTAVLEGRSSDVYTQRLEEIRDLALAVCKVNHSQGCNCDLCKLLQYIEQSKADALRASPPINTVAISTRQA